MRRPALYSSSRSRGPAEQAQPEADEPAAQATPVAARPRLDFASPRLLWLAIALLATALALSLVVTLKPAQRRLTQEDIDKAVLKTMETQTLPSEYAKAYENIRPSVVRVVSYVKKSRVKEAME